MNSNGYSLKQLYSTRVSKTQRLGLLVRLVEEFTIELRPAVADGTAADPIVQRNAGCYYLIARAGVARNHVTLGIDEQSAIGMNECQEHAVLISTSAHHHVIHFLIGPPWRNQDQLRSFDRQNAR